MHCDRGGSYHIKLHRFRWIACQIETLEFCKTSKARSEALQCLPVGLPETYDRILQNIKAVDFNAVTTLLAWLCCSTRSLPLAVLAQTTGIRRTGDSDRYRYFSDEVYQYPEDICEICSSLVREVQIYGKGTG